MVVVINKVPDMQQKTNSLFSAFPLPLLWVWKIPGDRAASHIFLNHTHILVSLSGTLFLLFFAWLIPIYILCLFLDAIFLGNCLHF